MDSSCPVAMQVAAHEAKLGHGKLAEELRDMIDAAKARVGQDASGKLIAIGSAAKPRGELANLLTCLTPPSRLGDMVLDKVASDSAPARHQGAASARAHQGAWAGATPQAAAGRPAWHRQDHDSLRAGGGTGYSSVPGTPRLAHHQVHGRDGYEASAGIRRSLPISRGVYFFDEFDAIGSQRGIANDVGEIRRVLNSFLQMIEQDHSNSLIIAATNHAEILDYALFRRFDDVVEYHLPPQQATDLIRSRLRHSAQTLPEGRAPRASRGSKPRGDLSRSRRGH